MTNPRAFCFKHVPSVYTCPRNLEWWHDKVFYVQVCILIYIILYHHYRMVCPTCHQPLQPSFLSMAAGLDIFGMPKRADVVLAIFSVCHLHSYSGCSRSCLTKFQSTMWYYVILYVYCRLQLRRIFCRGCMDLCNILLSLNNWNLISKQTIWEILSNGWRWAAAAVSEQGDEPPVVIRTFRCLWVRPLVCELAAFHSYPVTNQPYRLSKDKLGQVLSSFQLPGLDHVPSYSTWWQVHSWFWSSIVITPT